MKTRKFKHIEVMYSQYIEAVVKMFEEHYDIPKYDDTLFILNASWNYDRKALVSRDDLPKHKRYIYYSLEHYETYYGDYSYWGFNMYFPWLESMKFDEIWEFAYENIPLMPLQFRKQNVKFVPMRYTQSVVDDPLDVPKNKILGFLGAFNSLYPHRFKVIGDLQNLMFGYLRESKMMTLFGGDIDEFKPELSSCKYVLDTLNVSKDHKQYTTQNQVRIFENILKGYKVISEEVGGCNYFSGLIDEFPFPPDSDIDMNLSYGIECIHLLQRDYVDDHVEIRNRYKELTWKDDDFEKYKKSIIEQYNRL